MIDVYEVRDAIDTIQRFCGQSTRCVDKRTPAPQAHGFGCGMNATKLKRLEKYAYWTDLPSHAIQDITDRVDKGYKLFWAT